jgi:hypothetical protein
MREPLAELLATHTPDMLGAPFAVSLVASVRRDVNDAITIPALTGMIAGVAMARLWRDERLSGDELRFLRKTAGLTRGELGEGFGGDADDVGAYEKGPRPMTIGLEKYIRMHLFNAVRRMDGPRVDDMINYMEWTFDAWRPTFGDTSRPMSIRLRHFPTGWQELKD